MTDSYQDLFTWRNPLGEHCLAHHDGTVSLMVGWDGLDYDMLADQDAWDATVPLFDLLHNLDHRFYHEFHWWREKDNRAVDEYIAYNDKHIRGGPIAKEMRMEIAEHLRPFVYVNETALVVSHTPASLGVLRRLSSAKGQLKAQTKRAAELQHAVKGYFPYLPGANVLSHRDYIRRVLRTAHRTAHTSGSFRHDPYVFLNHQLVRKHELRKDDGLLYRDGLWHKVFHLPFYPDATPGWFSGLAFYGISMHAVLVVRPMDFFLASRQSENAERLSGAHTAKRGREFAQKHLQDEIGFRQMMVDNNLNPFRSCFICHLYDRDKEKVQSVYTTLRREIGQAYVEGGRPFQYPYFRVSQPGQGYKANELFLRKDHTWQVGGMIPSQVYRTGAKRGEQFRIGLNGQPVFLSFDQDAVNHALASAKTGSGKDVQNQQTVFETYPLGTNYYLLECGDSYHWTFEALGDRDSYITVDPEKTAVSPFPPYGAADLTRDYPLDANVVSGTIRALAFLLLDDKNAGNIDFQFPILFEKAAESALQYLYSCPRADREAPLFEDFHNSLADPIYLDGKPEEIKAAKKMAERLSAFLGTQAGSIFNRPTNVNLHPDIVGINLEPVTDIPRLFSFYLVFFSLRLSQLSNASPNPSRFVLNEFHIFVKQAKDVVGGLMDGIARMGRKRGKSLDLVTQENDEMDMISKAIINSLSHLTLLYREGAHREIGERLNVPPAICDVWAQFANPKSIAFRNCIRKYHDEYYNLLLTYPERFLHMTSTRKSHLDIKREISAATRDPFERLALFEERIYAHTDE